MNSTLIGTGTPSHSTLVPTERLDAPAPQTQMRKIWLPAANSTAALAVVFLLGSLAAPSADAWTFIVLHAFTGAPSDGAFPQAQLLMDAAGNLFGTTARGVFISQDCPGGCGTVFNLDPSGIESVLYSFKGPPDGSIVAAGLIMDAGGSLYGTTGGGGTIGQNCAGFPPGCGTVFKLDPSGTESLMYIFRGAADGSFPKAGLIMDTAGTLYGTASFGGFTGQSCSIGCGTVFKLSPFTFAGLISLVKQFISDPGHENIMVGMLEMAKAATAKGDRKTADRMLRTFIQQVSAQSGKSFSPHAATLIQEATSLMT